MSSRKMPQRYLYTVHEESGIPSTRPTCKKAKLNEVLAAHCRADMVTECMKRKKKTLILSGDFHFHFSAENECLFSFSFFFGRKCNFIFVGIFVYGRKWKNAFGRPLVYITKSLGLVLEKKFWLHHWLWCMVLRPSKFTRQWRPTWGSNTRPWY